MSTECGFSCDDASVSVRVLSAIGEIAAEAWDRCAGPHDPFVSHAFLRAMEDSGCVAAEERGV